MSIRGTVVGCDPAHQVVVEVEEVMTLQARRVELAHNGCGLRGSLQRFGEFL